MTLSAGLPPLLRRTNFALDRLSAVGGGTMTRYSKSPCRCNLEGTRRPVCDRESGACNCLVGAIGRRCDKCARGYQQEFPNCTLCHLCFDRWDGEITSHSLALQGLIRFTANFEKKRPFPSCDIYFKSLEDKLAVIEGILKSPLLSTDQFLKVKEYRDNIRLLADALSERSFYNDTVDYFGVRQSWSPCKTAKELSNLIWPTSPRAGEPSERQEVDDIFENLKELQELRNLNSTIEELMKEADRLFKDLERIRQRQKSAEEAKMKVCVDGFNKITVHYEASLAAEFKTYESLPILWSSSNTRTNIKQALGDLTKMEKENMKKLNKMTFLDVDKLNEKVCGTEDNASCDNSRCGGALCRNYFGDKKCGGSNCGGVLTLSAGALELADKADLLVNNFTRQLQESEQKITVIKKMATESKAKALKLNETLVKSMKNMEQEREKTKDLIQQVKKFLLDEFVPPEDIEKVANQVLAIKLPATPQDLLKLISKIKAYCDDYQQNKEWLEEQLEEAKNLSEAAKKAEEAAAALPNVDEIKKNLKKAEDVQTKTSEALEGVNNEIKEITNSISKAQKKADGIEDNLDDFSKRHSKLQEEISALQNKTVMNRNQAGKVKEKAKSALDRANEASTAMGPVKEKYELLLEKLKNREIPDEILQRIKRIKEEAENVAKEVDGKLQRIEDLEKKIDDLNDTKQDMEDTLMRLEREVTEHRDFIAKRERELTTCGV
ncbi:laminin subunit beta-4-like [Lissotriton helveticus]